LKGSCVHNLFIAIVERSFSSLKDNPILRGDESSDEEKEESVKGDDEKKKNQSQAAFSKILNSGKKSNKIFYDEITLINIQNMNTILDDKIVRELKNMLKIMEGFKKGTTEWDIAKEHLVGLIDLQILPVLDHFN
jgi:hypothetical protein